MFGLSNKKKHEEKMAEWLSHPSEFGESPKFVRLKKTYKAALIHENCEIHLMDYEMPNGFRGRGFVNGALTWSFLGDEVAKIDDASLVVAYCGWSWLFPALQSGAVATSFASQGEEARYLEQKQQQGLTDFVITERYLIGDSEVFGFNARFQGSPVRGAGNTENEVGFGESDPCFYLPSVYFLLGTQVIKSLR